MALILPFGGVAPRIAPDAFVAPTAVLIGNVSVEAEASVWFGAVLRGDHPEHGIVVGRRTSVQDNCVLHVGGWRPTLLGAHCTIGHGATLESCTVGDGCLVGMGAVILQNAEIGPGSLVAAGSVVLEGTKVPAGSLVAGVPAIVKGSLEGSAARWVEEGGRHYMELARSYLRAGVGRASPSSAAGASALEGGSG